MIKAPIEHIPRLMTLLRNALEKMGIVGCESKIESIAVDVFRAMSAPTRLYHTSQHIFDVAKGPEASQRIAALFHDVIYLPVDGGVPHHWQDLLAPYYNEDQPKHIQGLNRSDSPAWFRLTCMIFGVNDSADFTERPGLNEFLSTLVAGALLEDILPLKDFMGIAANIEATIPFRFNAPGPEAWYNQLQQRLLAADEQFELGFGEKGCTTLVHHAIQIANHDIGSFAHSDPSIFFLHTWQLIAEGHRILQQPAIYSLTDYLDRLIERRKFLEGINISRLFSSKDNVPNQAMMATMKANAARNIDLAVRFFSAKIYTISLIKAAALLTGGDLPVALFMGSLEKENIPERLLSVYFPPTQTNEKHFTDPMLDILLSYGLREPVTFDTQRSPITSSLYRNVGEKGISHGFETSMKLLEEENNPQAFLNAQPTVVSKGIFELLANFSIVRKRAFSAHADAT